MALKTTRHLWYLWVRFVSHKTHSVFDISSCIFLSESKLMKLTKNLNFSLLATVALCVASGCTYDEPPKIDTGVLDEKSCPITCAPTEFCSNASETYGQCLAKLASGSACLSDAQCTNDTACVQNVCKSTGDGVSCKTSSDCAANHVCDVNTCRPVVSCPGNADKNCFLALSLTPSTKWAGGVVSSSTDLNDGDFLGSTYEMSLPTDGNKISLCITRIQRIVSLYQTSQEYGGNSSLLPVSDVIKPAHDSYVKSLLTNDVKENLAAISQFAKTESHLMRDLERDMTENPSNYGNLTYDELSKSIWSMLTLPEFTERIDITGTKNHIGCLEMTINDPVELSFTLQDGTPWDDHAFYFVPEVSNSGLMSQVGDNNFTLSLAPSYEANLEEGVAYRNTQTFPMTSDTSDDAFFARFDPQSCNSEDCQNGKYKFSFKVTETAGQALACCEYDIRLETCPGTVDNQSGIKISGSDCTADSLTEFNEGKEDDKKCKANVTYELQRAKIYIELRGSDLISQ